MDEIPFSNDEGVIPTLALKNHMRKLYPYVEEGKLKMFVALVDINHDERVDVQEMFKFFSEIYPMKFENVILKLGQIIFSTNETIENFFKIH